ncbi:T9SS type B sorting domain-containing protein, partial [Flavobacterium sp.]
QLSSQSEGWNGTYNGQQMPATDYWFTVDYTEQNAEKQFRAHFSLKR